MTRRQCLRSLASLIALSTTGTPVRAEEPPTLFTDWVRRFYATQLAVRAKAEGHATAETEAALEPTLAWPLRDYLTAEMQALYDNAQNRQLPPDTLDGPILHEIFGWGALPNREIKLLAVTDAPWWQGLTTKNLALVTISINGNERDLTVKGHYDPATYNWEIADIDYGEGAGETLRERLQRMGTWKKRD